MGKKGKNQRFEGVRQRGRQSFRINYKDADGGRHWETLTANDGVFSTEDAAKVRRQRLADIDRGIPVSGKANTVKFEELAADVVNDYLVTGYSSVSDIEARYRLHLLPAFGNRKASQITTDQVKAYIVNRLTEGAKPGTINRELEAMRHAFLLARKATPPKVHMVPHFPMLEENNVRKGFFERYQLEAICRHLPAHLVPVARFGYITGWRHGEVVTLTLGHVHFEAGEVRLEPGETKNGKGRTFPMVDELRDLLRSIWPKGPTFPAMRLFRDANGNPIQRFDKSWATACRLAGLPVRFVPLKKRVNPKDPRSPKVTVLYKRGPKKGQPVLVCRAAVYFHDFRRTAYRNLVRLGVPPKVARLSVGWLNIKTADRYDVPDKSDLDVLRALYNAAVAGRLGASSVPISVPIAPSVVQNPQMVIERDRWKPTTDTDLMGIAPEGIEPPTRGLGNRCSILLSYGAARLILAGRSSVSDQRNDVVTVEAVAAFEEIEFHDERHGRHLAADLLSKPAGREARAAGRKQIVSNHDPGAGVNGVLVNLKRVHAVLELVADAFGGGGQLVGLADRDESRANVIGERGGENEAARFDAQNIIRLQRGDLLGQPVDHLPESGPVFQQRGDVVEKNARLRKIWNFADQLFQLVHS